MNPNTDTKPFYPVPEPTPERRVFYVRLNENNTAPLWEAMGRLIPPGPEPAAEPALWRYRDLRPLLMEAGALLPAGETERRVLMLENPGLGGRSLITQSLYAGVQLVLPGEVAPSHRHVTSALRLVLESDGAYTTVEGARMTMEPGDFILTPSWTFHEHGNPGSEPAVWVDCLDLPIVNLFDTSFAEHDAGSRRALERAAGGLHYRYRQSRDLLSQLQRSGSVHPRDGIRLDFSGPAVSGYPVSTIGASLQLLPAGFRGKPGRATDSRVFCVLEGRGESRIGDTVFVWEQHDIFAVPSWHAVSHAAESGDSVLFSFSDRPAQEALGLWRRDAPDAG